MVATRLSCMCRVHRCAESPGHSVEGCVWGIERGTQVQSVRHCAVLGVYCRQCGGSQPGLHMEGAGLCREPQT